MALETIPRPPIYQTFTPFVEVFINGVDILRGDEGRPRTLVSFQHQRVMMANGEWTLQVFDPGYADLEELLFGMMEAVPEGMATTGGASGTQDLTPPIMFRYGYVSQDGKEITTSPEGEKYFFGSIWDYTPTFQTNGTLLTLHGDSLGYMGARTRKLRASFYGKNIYEIIQKVCKVMDWELVPMGISSGEAELPPEKQPESVTTSNASVDTTEEQPVSFSMEEDEDAYGFIQRLCAMARSNSPQYNDYVCFLEFRTEGKIDGETAVTPTKPKGYLYYGPYDKFLTPVRKYVYMRDPESDVISFTPNVSVAVAAVSGLPGVVFKADDNRTGVPFVGVVDGANQDQKTFRTRRATLSFAQMQAFQEPYQEGTPENEDTEDRGEGGGSDTTMLTTPEAPDINAPQTEISLAITEQQQADRSAMAWWLGMHQYVTSATLEIVGDPAPELFLTENVAVMYYVPDVEGRKFSFHWSSQIWTIVGVVHTIQGGSYTTQLDLSANSSPRGGIASRAAWRAIISDMDEGAMKKLGG